MWEQVLPSLLMALVISRVGVSDEDGMGTQASYSVYSPPLK